MRTFRDVYADFLYQQTVFFCHLFVLFFSVDMSIVYDFDIVR
jgi:hypothetical protein